MNPTPMTCVLCRGMHVQAFYDQAFSKCLNCGFMISDEELANWDADDLLTRTHEEVLVYVHTHRANIEYLATHAAVPLARICAEFVRRGVH